MPGDPTLDRLERKAFHAYHRDGIVDLLVGLMALGFGIGMWTNSTTLFALVWLPTIFYRPLRSWLVVPRLGYASFGTGGAGPARSARRWVVLLLAGSVALGLVTFMATNSSPEWRSFMRAHPLLFFGGLGALGLTVGGLATKLWRFVGYGAVAALIAVVGDQVGLAPEPGVTAIGAIIVVLGLGRLTWFLTNFPKLPNDASAAS